MMMMITQLGKERSTRALVRHLTKIITVSVAGAPFFSNPYQHQNKKNKKKTNENKPTNHPLPKSASVKINPLHFNTVKATANAPCISWAHLIVWCHTGQM